MARPLLYTPPATSRSSCNALVLIINVLLAVLLQPAWADTTLSGSSIEQLIHDGASGLFLQVNGEDSELQQAVVKRADALIIDGNNSPMRGNVASAQTNSWRYPKDLLLGSFANDTPGLPSDLSAGDEKDEGRREELRRRNFGLRARQSTSRVAYISMNTCVQPQWTGSGQQTEAPPQLKLYIGRSGNETPGPGSTGQQDVLTLEEGFLNRTVQTDSDIYLTVAAPAASANFRGSWSYDLAVSINDFYHSATNDVTFLYLVDTDTTSALLITDNLTQAAPADKVFQQWMNLSTPLPFTIFANVDSDRRRLGVQLSYCGLNTIKQIGGSQLNATSGATLTTDMITRGLGNKPKQQFLVSNLTRATMYDVSLALVGNGAKSGKGVVGGGGTVWQATSWTTKSDGNCQLLYNLPFCDEVAYAAPSNPQNFNVSALGSLYDNYAIQLYQNFSYSLQQISCNATNDERYSLARNCKDCAHAYKQWLCAVTVPRCEDFSNDASYLQPRNVGQPFFQNGTKLADSILYQPYRPMTGAPTLPGSPIDQTWFSSFATNQSRNPAIIDNKIAPGPYKEVLPCEDLCYSLVQSCPAALQFSCPLPGRGLERSYGKRPDSNTIIECSYLGAVYYIDDASRRAPQIIILSLIAFVVIFVTSM